MSTIGHISDPLLYMGVPDRPIRRSTVGSEARLLTAAYFLVDFERRFCTSSQTSDRTPRRDRSGRRLPSSS